MTIKQFQYRKRYGLHAITELFTIVITFFVSIPQAVWIACNSTLSTSSRRQGICFNTASGMDCMQLGRIF